MSPHSGKNEMFSSRKLEAAPPPCIYVCFYIQTQD